MKGWIDSIYIQPDRRRIHPLLACILFLPLLFQFICCTEGRKPNPSTEPKDPEVAAAEAFRALEEEFNYRESELRSAIRLGEADPEEIAKLEGEFRLRQEKFVKEYEGTNAATGVIIGFALVDMDNGEFASAEQRLDEIISSLEKGDNLALAMVHKSNLVADHDLDAALDLVRKAEKIEGVGYGTLLEARVQRLKLYEWLKKDMEFDALYLQLIEENVGPYIETLTFLRLRQFLRQGKMDAAKGLIDSSEGRITEDMVLALKGEFIAQNLTGSPVQSFEGKDIAGFDFNLSDLKGKTVVLIFLTTGNPQVLRIITTLNKMYDDYSSKGLEIVGISVDVKPDDINPFVARNNIAWPVLHDANGKIQEAYFVMRDPRVFIIDRDGNLADHGLEGVLLEKKIRELLGLPDDVNE